MRFGNSVNRQMHVGPMNERLCMTFILFVLRKVLFMCGFLDNFISLYFYHSFTFKAVLLCHLVTYLSTHLNI